MVFSNQLLKWYRLNFRQLPWRETTDPYKIWVSEVILQQTRVAQGLPYYLRFIQKYPDVKALAKCNLDDLLKLWQGLGYYSRARNMHFTANEVMRLYKGKFPSDYNSLIRLKGIGEYTAAAVSSFSTNEKQAVVDGNVYRILSRYFGISTPIDSAEGKKIFKIKAQEILHAKEPGLHNQALMEFGAMVCSPSKPDCVNCIFQIKCAAYQTGNVPALPVKAKKTKVRNRYLHYFVIHDGKHICMKKRTEKDIWHNLFDFPLVETEKKVRNDKEFLKRKNPFTDIKTDSDSFRNSKIKVTTVKHLLSHQKLEIRFLEMKVEKLPVVKKSVKIKLNRKNLPGVPQVVLNYLENQKWFANA